jgi:hypothetical protein
MVLISANNSYILNQISSFLPCSVDVIEPHSCLQPRGVGVLYVEKVTETKIYKNIIC